MDMFVWFFFYSRANLFLKDCDMAGKSNLAFPPLESVTKPNLTTHEIAFYTNLTAQTWRVKACYDTVPGLLLTDGGG